MLIHCKKYYIIALISLVHQFYVHIYYPFVVIRMRAYYLSHNPTRSFLESVIRQMIFGLPFYISNALYVNR